MRLNTVIIFALTLFNVNCEASDRPLNVGFELICENYLNNSVSDSFWDKLKSIDIECVKERIKLTENGNKLINDTFLTVLLVSSFGICSGSLNNFTGDFVDTMIELRSFEIKEECFKLALQEVEPDAVILRGFNSNATLEDCNKEKFDKTIETIETEANKVHQFTCGVIKKEEIFKTTLKFTMIGFKQLDEAAEKEARSQLIEFFADKFEKIEKCIIKLIESS